MLRISGILLALLVSSAFASEPPSPTPSVVAKNEEHNAASKNTTTEKNKKSSNISSAVTNQTITINSKSPHNENTNTTNNPPSSDNSMHDSITDWIIAIATIVIGAFTIGLFIDARAKGRKELRAYVSSSPNFVGNFSKTKPAWMRFAIENHGQTPAYKIQRSAIVEIFPFPLPQNFNFPNLPDFTPSTHTLHPREKHIVTIPATRLFSEKEIIDACQENGCRLYCFGIIRYETFSKIHTTRFCFSIDGSDSLLAIATGGIPNVVDLNFRIDEQHNDAD